MTKQYELHPFADIFPMLEGEAFHALVADIEARSQQEPVWHYEGKILDGRNRYRACQILKREVITKEYTGNDPMGFVLSANLHRRHLNESQRAMVAANLTKLVEVGTNQHTRAGPTTKEAAALLNVSTASIERARSILKTDPDLAKDVTVGKTTVNAATQDVKTGRGKRKPKTNPPSTEETAEQSLAKEKIRLSDKINGLVDKLVGTLKDLKTLDADNAIAATSKLIRDLKTADLIEGQKGKKAA